MGFYHGYHNHKETMAWVATVFYVPSIIVAGFKVRDIVPCWQQLLVFTGIIAVSILVWLFVRMQFDRREYANYTVLGLRRVLVKLDSRELQQFCYEFQSSQEWPQQIEDAINLVKKCPDFGKYARCSKNLTYVAVGLSTLIALVLAGVSLCS